MNDKKTRGTTNMDHLADSGLLQEAVKHIFVKPDFHLRLLQITHCT